MDPMSEDKNDLFDLADDVNTCLRTEEVPLLDTGYQNFTVAGLFDAAFEAVSYARKEAGLHHLCAPQVEVRDIFFQHISAALKAVTEGAEVVRFESKPGSEYAWLFSNGSIILIVAQDPNSSEPC